jgi:GxxExxY protein
MWKSGNQELNMTELGNKELSDRVIEVAIAVHSALGPGFLESVCENTLCLELDLRGIRFERQKTIKIIYEGREVGEHRLDLLVEEGLLVELKAVRVVDDVFFAIGRSYMKAVGVHDGPPAQFCQHAPDYPPHWPRAVRFLIS